MAIQIDLIHIASNFVPSPKEQQQYSAINTLVAVFLALNTPGSSFDLPRPPHKM